MNLSFIVFELSKGLMEINNRFFSLIKNEILVYAFREIMELIMFCFLGFGLSLKVADTNPRVNLGYEFESLVLGFAS